MDKLTYFRKCMAEQAYRSKGWVIAAFSLAQGELKEAFHMSDIQKRILKLTLRHEDNKPPYFIDPDTNQKVTLDSPGGIPAFRFKDTVTLEAGWCENLTETVETTYGAWLFNQIVVVYPFGNKIAFSKNGYSIKEIEKIIESRLRDDPDADQESKDAQLPPLKQPLYVREYIKYNEAAGSLTGLTQLCVPAATPFTLTVDPRVLKRRQELLEQYKDRLNDPVIQAKIGNELVALDKQILKEDPDRGFYYRDKSFEVVRKALFLFQGAEGGFGKRGDFIATSLDEGSDLKDLPALANAQRDGSYSRGAQTELGGVTTKLNLRIFQNSVVVPEDCGTTIGKPLLVTAGNFDTLVGNYRIVDKTPVRIESTDKDALIGKTIELRSPMFCHAQGANFCAICVGDGIASTPDALSTYAADIGSAFMLSMMKKMHGKALKTERYDIKRSIR